MIVLTAALLVTSLYAIAHVVLLFAGKRNRKLSMAMAADYQEEVKAMLAQRKIERDLAAIERKAIADADEAAFDKRMAEIDAKLAEAGLFYGIDY